MPDGEMHPLLTCYALEAEIYDSLLELAVEQGDILERGGSAQRCAAVAARKAALLHSLAGIERDIEPLKRRWWTDDVAPAHRERLEALLDSILATIEAVVAQEERNHRLLERRQAQLHEEFAG